LDQTRELRRYDRQHDPARVLALSDGVFAIVITLLVLEIHVPELTGGQSLPEALHEVRPSFIAFLISFLVTAIAWAGHRELFAHIRRTDRTLVWLNLVYLLPLSLLPFGAALISRYDRESVALSLFGIQVLLIAVTRLIVWLYATNRPHLLYEPIGRRTKTVGVLIVAGQAVLYVLAILIAGSAPGASMWIYAAVPVLYFIAIIVDRSTAPPGAEEDEFA
jgi:TMEM175 potassium channel family protein